ncbi:MAG: hypothetical protein H0W25_13650 [Acidimicrobiia bacterium]|nr:hypothetical protein [Acidimicrobiia bacterium]
MDAEDRADTWLKERYQGWIADGRSRLESLRVAPEAPEPSEGESGDGDAADDGLVEPLRRLEEAYASAGISSDEWSFHGLVFGKPADEEFLEAAANAPSSDRRDQLVELFRARIATANVVERMWALYDRLFSLAAAGESLTQDEAQTYVSWLGDLGIDPGEVTVAAADVGVAVDTGEAGWEPAPQA